MFTKEFTSFGKLSGLEAALNSLSAAGPGAVQKLKATNSMSSRAVMRPSIEMERPLP